MSQQPITQAEMMELFGATMPIEAVTLIWESPPEMTIGEVRAKLRTMGAAHKRHRAAADALAERLKGLKGYFTDPSTDWPWVFYDASRIMLAAADAVGPKLEPEPFGYVYVDEVRAVQQSGARPCQITPGRSDHPDWINLYMKAGDK